VDANTLKKNKKILKKNLEANNKIEAYMIFEWERIIIIKKIHRVQLKINNVIIKNLSSSMSTSQRK
jgi:hypothetical protein